MKQIESYQKFLKEQNYEIVEEEENDAFEGENNTKEIKQY